jgi:Na+/H+ antiporter NhaD/arsenite permease-like protein
MMMLVVVKRIKAAKKAKRYKNHASMPGLPPLAMLGLYIWFIVIIAVLAHFKFVNETLVFAVLSCVLVFIYMLKLTLFDTQKKPVLLAAPNSDWDTDSRLDERFY